MFLTQNFLRIPNNHMFSLRCAEIPNIASKKKLASYFFAIYCYKNAKNGYLKNACTYSTFSSVTYCMFSGISPNVEFYHCFLNRFQNFKCKNIIFKIGGSSFVEVVKTRVCFLLAICPQTPFLTNFQTSSTSRLKSACSDVTKSKIQKTSV